MYEIFIWTAIGLVLLNLVWQLYRCYEMCIRDRYEGNEHGKALVAAGPKL